MTDQLPRFTPRPTTYCGVAMRSRLEARYAALFDKCGLRWEYEPDCFASPGGQYLPDFRLLDVHLGHAFVPGWLDPFMAGRARSVYVEVKPPGHDLAEVCRRMEIIRESDADAPLLLLSEEYSAGPAGSDGLISMPAIGGTTEWLQAWLVPPDTLSARLFGAATWCGHGLLVVGLWTHWRLRGCRIPEDSGCAA